MHATQLLPDSTRGREARIRAALERYFDALNRRDPEAYADCWTYPATVWSHERWWQIPDRDSCIENNRGYEREARCQGMAGGRIHELRVQLLGATSALASGVFSRVNTDGGIVATVQASYLLVEIAGEWRIGVCVVKD